MSALPHELLPAAGPSGEADHRIANSLAIISGLVRLRARCSDGVDHPETFLLEIADRIETIADLHRLLAHSAAGTIRLDTYLQQICGRLGKALGTNAPECSVHCSPDQFVPSRVALPLGLITAELFSNSLKYAHPAGLRVKIRVACSRSAPGELTYGYDDDGVGFPEGFDLSHDGHLGMRLVRSLSDQLGASQKWLSDPLGIQFEIRFPCEVECGDGRTRLGRAASEKPGLEE